VTLAFGDNMKLKRGQKLCKKCNGINGARSHVCKHCNTEFTIGANAKNKPAKIKKTKKYEEIEDWRSLKRGDRVKVVGRSGNYYVNNDGERQYLTDMGVYTVQEIDDLGLRVYDGGYGYIYMGPEVASDTIPNMYRSPHKLLKVNTPIRPVLR
jgi:ribosomal protein L40E